MNDLEKEAVLRLIYKLQGENISSNEFIAREKGRTNQSIFILNQTIYLFDKETVIQFSLEPTLCKIYFRLNEKTVEFNVEIGNIPIHKELFSYRHLIATLTTYTSEKQSVKDKVKNSLKPLIEQYFKLFHGLCGWRFPKLSHISAKDENKTQQRILEGKLDIGEYYIEKDSGLLYIDCLNVDDIKVTEVESKEMITYIREGGGNLIQIGAKITTSDISELLEALALIDHPSLVKGLIQLDLGINDERELNSLYDETMMKMDEPLVNINIENAL